MVENYQNSRYDSALLNENHETVEISDLAKTFREIVEEGLPKKNTPYTRAEYENRANRSPGAINQNELQKPQEQRDREALLDKYDIDHNYSYETQEKLLAEKQGIKGLWNSIKDRDSDFGIEIFFIIGFAILVFLFIKAKLK